MNSLQISQARRHLTKLLKGDFSTEAVNQYVAKKLEINIKQGNYHLIPNIPLQIATLNADADTIRD